MKLVGLTGGIASGKSTVARMFTDLGVDVIDADRVSREICAPGQVAIDPIRQAFGDTVLDEQGGLDRLAMRDIVFSDPEKLHLLESIIHPLIYSHIGNWLRDRLASGSTCAILEATLIIEAPPPVPLDALIVVLCDENTRIERVKMRDGFDEQHIRSVLNNQMTDQQRLQHADYVIVNDGSEKETRRRVVDVWKELCSA